MSTPSTRFQVASLKLHRYLLQKHWTGQALVGPDPVGKIQWRVTRFIRSYAPALPHDDCFTYLQGQAYWIRSNLSLYEFTRNDQYLGYVIPCADAIVARQPANGAWVHPPVRERRGFISTVEGVWGSLGLTAAYQATGKEAYLEAARRWYDFQIQGVGFQVVGEGVAPNYYTHSTIAVPNVTTMLLWLTHELYQITHDRHYLEYTDRMLTFVEQSQLPTGELPYTYRTRPHFMCFQYNSYQLLDLIHAYELRPSARLYAILRKLAAFVSTGVLPSGSCRYDCFKETPEVNYWNAVIAHALRKADELGLGNYLALSERAYEHVLTQQRSDGGFIFSHYNYRFLSDKRSYPRYLAMILHHLLSRMEEGQPKSPENILSPKALEQADLSL